MFAEWSQDQAKEKFSPPRSSAAGTQDSNCRLRTVQYRTVLEYSLPPPLIWLPPPLLSLLLSSLSLLPLPSLPPHLCQVPPTAPHPRSFGQSDARPAQELAVGGGEEAITPNSACFSSPPPCIPISTFIFFFPYFFLASLPPGFCFCALLSCLALSPLPPTTGNPQESRHRPNPLSHCIVSPPPSLDRRPVSSTAATKFLLK